MKKCRILTILLVVASLAGCGGAGAPDSDSVVSDSEAAAPMISAQSTASIGSHSTISTDIDMSSPPQNFNCVPVSASYGEFGDTMLSEEQNTAIVTLIQNVVTGYREGWLPLPIAPNSEPYLCAPLPQGIQLPEKVSYADIAISSDGAEMGVLIATLPLEGGYQLDVRVEQITGEERGILICIVGVDFVLT